MTGNRLLIAVSALGVAVLLALGTWQVQRLQWKQDLISKRQQALTANPISLADIEAGIEHGFDVDWLKVKATGQFRHDLERHVYDLRKGKIGWRIITPFIVPGQFIVLVDRGFVPDDRKDPASRPQSQKPSAEQEISGFTRVNPGASGPFTPDNQPATNRWYSFDLPAMTATLPDDLGFVPPDGYASVLAVTLQLASVGKVTPGTLPIADPVNVKVSNNHLQYAVTWYALALVLIVVSFLFYRSRRLSPPGHDPQ